MVRHTFFAALSLAGLAACTVDNPAFSPPEPPCENGETYYRQPFQVADASKVDILFVIDNGTGMAGAQERLAESMPLLVQSLNAQAGLDWQLGVTSTDVTGVAGELLYGGDRVPGCPTLTSNIIRRSTPEALLAASCAVQLGEAGSDFEQGWQAARFGLRNTELTRPDARKVVIFVSNEDDCSATAAFNQGAPSNCRTQQDLLFDADLFLQTFRGEQSRSGDALTFVALVAGTGDAATPIQCGDVEEAFAGNRYAELATSFGRLGMVENLCSASLDRSMQNIIDNVILAPDDVLCLQSPLNREPTDVVLRVDESSDISVYLSPYGDYISLGATDTCAQGAVSINREAHNVATGQRVEIWFCSADTLSN
jgi:hypothetical protein